MQAVWACVGADVSSFALVAANDIDENRCEPPIPRAGPLAQPRSPQQLSCRSTRHRRSYHRTIPRHLRKIALGQKLFFDGRLSADGTVACASCHNPERAFTDGKPTS
jgi:cytochrome c peroxidase